MDYLWLRLQNPQASQNVVRSLNNQRPCLDIEEQLEVHCKAELHKDPENLQGRSTQAMVSCPHESQSLCTSQPPGNKVKYKQTNNKNYRAWQRGPHFISCISGGRWPDLRAWTSLKHIFWSVDIPLTTSSDSGGRSSPPGRASNPGLKGLWEETANRTSETIFGTCWSIQVVD